MQGSNWDDLRSFLAVSERGSIAAAAKFLNVNHSTVLRRLANLEKRLGARLFDRLPKGYELTAQGEELRHRLQGVSEQIDDAQRSLSGRDLGLAGAIRITTTDTLMHGLLMPCLAEFRAAHPAIQLEIVINNTFLNLTRRDADIAVRPSNTVPENLVGRRIGRLRTAVYASKKYLKENGSKKEWGAYDWTAPDEALAHLEQAKWIRENVPDDRIVVRIDSLLGMFDAVRHGMGAGLLLSILADDDPDLVRLTEPLAELDTDVWILSHPALKGVARVKALSGFLYDKLRSGDELARVDSR
ncbi:MAG TPA: LysR family transcriptional regulator [Candidatus Binatia bacterium]|nr:LysR family transcriptional regulator [Candidatus Binatia bacterium]